MNKQDELGFTSVKTGSYYDPVFLRCVANEQIKLGNHTKTKKFAISQSISLWCLYGRDMFDEYHLFCKEESDEKAFTVLRGSFSFEFNAEAFANIAINASKNSWRYFTSHAFMTDEMMKFNGEEEKFWELIEDKLTERKLRIVRSSMRELKDSLKK